MKATGFVTLGLVASLCACSDDGATIDPTGTAGATAGAAAGTAGTATAGTTGTAGVGTPPSGAAGSGGRAAAGSGAAGRAATGGAGAAAGASGSTVAGTGGAGAGGGDAAGTGGAMAGTGGMGGNQGTAGTDPLPPIPADKALPIVFVHGFAGSAQQFQSQAMRFVMNGYPQERILAYDHDGAGSNYAAFANGLEEVIDGALAKFSASKVFLVGHSRGTAVSSNYLGNPTRAAKVEKYIAIDGGACPTNVPCIAPNQPKFPGQEHVEVCTSKESFAMQYEFLMGTEPQVVDIVRQKAPVQISGRAVNFPANTGRAGATLKLYPVDAATGARTQTDAVATFMIGEDGNWGPTEVNPDTFYELELTASTGIASHFYFQRFLRSTDFVRLLSGGPDSPARMNTNTGDGHAAMVVSRQREWLATDVLEVSTKSPSGDQAVVNAMTSAAGMALSIGIHIHDDAASPGDSSLRGLPYFSSQLFQYGVDVFMPAADPPNGTITVRNLPRGDMSKPQVLNVPNWSSSKHVISIGFNDFPQD